MADDRVRIRAELENQVSKGLHSMRTDFDGLAKSDGARSILQGVGLGAGVTAWGLVGSAIGGVTDFIGDSIKAASDMNETQSKSKVIFAESAGAMDKFGDRAAAAYGLAKQSAIEAGATFGNFFRGVGEDSATAEQMSEKIVGLAGDLASFNNLDPEDVLQKLRSGLTGEAEPLRSVGVFLTEAKVKAKAMQMGLADAHGELSEGAKVLARYQVILEETATAQGDFARTADGNANSQRRVTAEMKNLEAEIGQKMLPLQLEWDKAQLQIIETLNAAADATHADTNSKAENVDILRTILNLYPGLGDALLGNTAQALANAEAMSDLSHFAGKAHDDIATLPAATRPGTAGLLSLADAADQARQKTAGLVDELVNHLYGTATRAGREQELKDQIAGLKGELATTTDRGDAIKLKGQIAGLRGELFDLQLQEADAEGPTAAIAWLEKIRKKTAASDQETLNLIDSLEALRRAEVKLPGGARLVLQSDGSTRIVVGAHKARGGPVGPGWEGWVGEEGPEYMKLGGAGGYVYPAGAPAAAAAGGGSGAPVVISLQIDGRQIARVVDDHLYYSMKHSAATGLRA